MVSWLNRIRWAVQVGSKYDQMRDRDSTHSAAVDPAAGWGGLTLVSIAYLLKNQNWLALPFPATGAFSLTSKKSAALGIHAAF
jgi:hypothetical protein